MASALFEQLPPPGRDVATQQQVDERFDQVDERFARIDERFEQIDERFEQVDLRFERLEGRFDRLEAELDVREERLRASLTAAWRRDLLLHSTGQFFALVAAVAALVALG